MKCKTPPTDPPKAGGVIAKKCRFCGGPVMVTGKGVLVERCTRCGKGHRDIFYKGP